MLFKRLKELTMENLVIFVIILPAFYYSDVSIVAL